MISQYFIQNFVRVIACYLTRAQTTANSTAAMIAVTAKKTLWKVNSRKIAVSAGPGVCFPCNIASRSSSSFETRCANLSASGQRVGVSGAFGVVDPLRDCLSSWRRRTVMKPFLNVFRKFNEIDF